MAKQDSPPIVFEESWTDHPAVQWIIQNGKQLSYGLIALLLLLTIVYQFVSRKSSQAEQEFIQGKQWLVELSNPAKADEAFQKLQDLLARYPELQPTYDGLIAQKLILQGKIDQAAPFVNRTFQRVGSETPAGDLEYSKISILLALGEKGKALERSYALKDNMLQVIKQGQTPLSFGETVYLFNLMRIALLEREAGNKEAEQKGWSEVSSIEQGNHVLKVSPQEFQRVMTHFDDKSATLSQFISSP